MLTVAVEAAVLDYRSSGYLSRAINEALSVLPHQYLNSIPDVVTIDEVSLKSDELFQSEDLCKIDEGVQFGMTKKFHISISSKLVQLAEKNTNVFKCGHKTFRKLLKAVIVHELTHVKDNKERISLDPDFQRIVGMKKVTSNSKKRLTNQNTLYSPDAYEFVNLEEALAVNVEYLVLDTEFECRKPATATFLSKRLGIPLRGKCQKNYKVIAQSSFLEDNYQTFFSIDPKRVYQVHYLFAGKGRALMSRWGHAMFRLIVCAPFRKVAGPECLDDVSHHLALSYRAYMSDINISYAKGVFGGYPSQLFIMRYLEVQQEYTKFELRDLFSIPLKMSSVQKKEFLDLTLERYWTYQGKYYFIDNNCGTETVKHLAVALEDEESKLIGSITPLRIYNDIMNQKNNLMVEKRLLIQSMFNDINDSYQFLKKYLPSFNEKRLDKFLKKSTATKRLPEYRDLIEASRSMDIATRKEIAIKLVHFERYLASRFLIEFPKKVLAKMNKDEGLKAEVMKMGETLKLLSVQPWQVIKPVYGVPTAPEFEIQFPRFKEKRNSDLKASMESQMINLQNILGKKHFEKELSELEKLKEIKTITSEFMTEISNIL
jgi:hypothetical protein